MSPQMQPSFEHRVTTALGGLLSGVGTSIEIDSVSRVDSRVLMVEFHLEGGNWRTPAGFTFPFSESLPLDDSLRVVRDLISTNCFQAS